MRWTVLATKPNLRLVARRPTRPGDHDASITVAADPTASIRTAGGAVLVSTPDTRRDDPATWTCATAAPADGPGEAATSTWRGDSSAA